MPPPPTALSEWGPHLLPSLVLRPQGMKTKTASTPLSKPVTQIFATDRQCDDRKGQSHLSDQVATNAQGRNERACPTRHPAPATPLWPARWLFTPGVVTAAPRPLGSFPPADASFWAPHGTTGKSLTWSKSLQPRKPCVLVDLFSRTPGNQGSAEFSPARPREGSGHTSSHEVHMWQNHLGTQEPRLEQPSSF